MSITINFPRYFFPMIATWNALVLGTSHAFIHPADINKAVLHGYTRTQWSHDAWTTWCSLLARCFMRLDQAQQITVA